MNKYKDLVIKREEIEVNKDRGRALLATIEADAYDLEDNYQTPKFVVINKQDVWDIIAYLHAIHGSPLEAPVTLSTPSGDLHVVIFEHDGRPKVVGYADATLNRI